MSDHDRRSFLKKTGSILGISFAGLVGPGMAVSANERSAWTLSSGAEFPKGQVQEEGFVSIFDGASLEGWHVSTESGHSSASNHESGGEWKVERGAIWGSQDIPGNGGIIITDELYGDFEVALEMKNDFGVDSGLFLRSTEDGTAYQNTIDYREGGSLCGIYGEGLDGVPFSRNMQFGDTPYEITEHYSPTPLPVLPEAWTYFWRHGQWNEIRARIMGNPPSIVTWVNGVTFMEWSDDAERHPDTGGIALQVHGGGNQVGEWVRYRNIRVKEL